MTDWDRLVLCEAGLLAFCAFIAAVVVAFFGDNLHSFWGITGAIIVVTISVRITLWLAD